jgi:PhoH-like ATPase
MKKDYVIDTNVLIDNPNSLEILRNGEENNIYLPLEVIIELDKLKTSPRIGGLVREAINFIIKNKEWINITYDKESLQLFLSEFDGKILNNIQKNLKNGILVTNDKLMKLITEKIFKYPCEEFKQATPYLSDSENFTGFCDYENLILNNFIWVEGKPVFNGIDGEKVINYEHKIWGITPRNIYQNLAFELLLNPKIDLITLQSQAGYGKSILALAAAFHLVFQEKKYKKIFITKSSYDIDKELGSLPGKIDEKFAPIIRPIVDLIYKLHESRSANKLFSKDNPEMFNSKIIELLPLNYVQGMNIENSILIIDEGQNLARKTMRTITTRCGENTKLFVIGDTRQVINPFINEFNNGLNWLVKLCRGKPNYGHLVLKGKTSRGPITDLILECGL